MQVAVVVSPSAVAARYNAPVSIDLCPNDISSTTFGPMWTHRTSAPEPVLWRFFFLLFCIHFMRRTSFISVINKQHNKSGIFQSMRNVRSSLNPLAWCLWCWVMLLIEIHMPNNSNTNIENKILFEWKKNGVLPKCTPQRERHLFLSFVVCSSLRCTSFFSRTCDAWTIRRHDICQCSVFLSIFVDVAVIVVVDGNGDVYSCIARKITNTNRPSSDVRTMDTPPFLIDVRC